MSEEIKKTAQPEPAEVAEVAEQELDQVSGGKQYLESRSNTAVSAVGVPAPKPSPRTQPVITKPAAG